MKPIAYFIIILLSLTACNSTKNKTVKEETKPVVLNDTITISNEELEYEIIIFEPGFSNWLLTNAKPEGFYSLSYLENKNLFFVNEWNNRVSNPSLFGPNLYEMPINYENSVDYGYDVNYKLYNYFMYFQLKYKQQLTGIVPRN